MRVGLCDLQCVCAWASAVFATAVYIYRYISDCVYMYVYMQKVICLRWYWNRNATQWVEYCENDTNRAFTLAEGILILILQPPKASPTINYTYSELASRGESIYIYMSVCPFVVWCLYQPNQTTITYSCHSNNRTRFGFAWNPTY